MRQELTSLSLGNLLKTYKEARLNKRKTPERRNSKKRTGIFRVREPVACKLPSFDICPHSIQPEGQAPKSKCAALACNSITTRKVPSFLFHKGDELTLAPREKLPPGGYLFFYFSCRLSYIAD